MDTNDLNAQYNIEAEDMPGSRRQITGEIPWDEVASHRDEVIKEFANKVEVDGFRKGNVPEDVVVNTVGEDHILHHMAEHALQAVYPQIIATHAPKAVGRPHLSITKMAKGNPLGFKAEVAMLPEIDLPDYTVIAEQQTDDTKEIEISESDVEEAIENIKRQWAQSEQMEKIKQMSEDAEEFDPTQLEMDEESLPELTDEFVQKLGEFENVADFKSKLRQNMLQEEQRKAHERRRLAIIEGIIEKSTMEVPDILVESELERMMNQFRADVEHANVEFDDYLEQVDKTEEGLRDEWRPDAEKQAKMQLVLNAIAAQEEIEASEEEVEKEVERITQEYKNADTERARVYVSTMLRNEKVFQFLENQ